MTANMTANLSLACVNRCRQHNKRKMSLLHMDSAPALVNPNMFACQSMCQAQQTQLPHCHLLVWEVTR